MPAPHSVHPKWSPAVRHARGSVFRSRPSQSGPRDRSGYARGRRPRRLLSPIAGCSGSPTPRARESQHISRMREMRRAAALSKSSEICRQPATRGHQPHSQLRSRINGASTCDLPRRNAASADLGRSRSFPLLEFYPPCPGATSTRAETCPFRRPPCNSARSRCPPVTRSAIAHPPRSLSALRLRHGLTSLPRRRQRGSDPEVVLDVLVEAGQRLLGQGGAGIGDRGQKVVGAGRDTGAVRYLVFEGTP